MPSTSTPSPAGVPGSQDIDPARCPICGAPNGCGRCAEGPETAHCWCEDLYIPRAVLERVPPEAKNRACICRSCLLRGGAVDIRL